MFGEIYSAAQQGIAIWLPSGNSKIAIRHALLAGMWQMPLKIGLRAVLRLGKLNNRSVFPETRF